MFLFIRLYLAHCLGDFPLQTSYVFKLKQKGSWGVLLHVFIIMACCLALSWPLLSLPQVWAFIAFIGITHFVQDRLKLNFSNKQSHFWLYILDQLFHLGVIALIFLTDLKHLQPAFDQTNLFLGWYNNDQLMITLISLILTTYNGFFLIESFKISFFKQPRPQTSFEKWFGMLERALLMFAFQAQDHVWILLPGILSLRLIVFLWLRTRASLPADFISFKELAMSLMVGLLGGLALTLCL